MSFAGAISTVLEITLQIINSYKVLNSFSIMLYCFMKSPFSCKCNAIINDNFIHYILPILTDA